MMPFLLAEVHKLIQRNSFSHILCNKSEMVDLMKLKALQRMIHSLDTWRNVDKPGYLLYVANLQLCFLFNLLSCNVP